MKKTLCWVLLLALTMSLLFGCSKDAEKTPAKATIPPGTLNKDLPELDLKNISYEKTTLTQEEEKKVALVLKPKSADAGEEVKVTVTNGKQMSGYFYYIVDWGDGTWSHVGPYKSGVSGTVTHIYKEPGQYDVRGACFNIERDEWAGWSKARTITISGSSYTPSYIKKVVGISSGADNSGQDVDKLSDNDNATTWKSKLLTSDQAVWVGYEFDTYYSMDYVEFKVPTNGGWPSDFAVEYTTDRGEHWYSLPKYYYLYDYAKEGGHSVNMHYPNPSGATIALPLDGIVANGIRIVAKNFDSGLPCMEIAELRVSGDQKPLFYSSYDGYFNADLNNMWTIYGTAASEPRQNGDPTSQDTGWYRTGAALINSTEWALWDGMKVNWTVNNEETFQSNADMLYNIRLDDDGYGNKNFVWATTGGREHFGCNHYSLNSVLIIAARNFVLQGNDTTLEKFLERKNGQRQVMKDRLEDAMDYMLTVCKGETGVFTIVDPNNDGTDHSGASNYWDGISAFGYISSYENVLFYQALLAMADLEYVQGDLEKGSYYLDLAKKTKEKFNETFWDENKGRYITSIDVNGTRNDLGLTFTNFMACEAGLADEEKAKKIYDWIDGKRIVKGDKFTGEEIYGKYTFSAVVNTVYFVRYWSEGTRVNIQNEGTIFYISHYDMMGRLRCLGADNAMDRFHVILKEFHETDSLRVWPYLEDERGRYSYIAGVIGEFPESGLVPLTFVNGFLGIQPERDGLGIRPNLPSDMTYAGVREYKFYDKVYEIEARTDVTEATCEQTSDNTWKVCVPADKDWILKPDGTVQEAA